MAVLAALLLISLPDLARAQLYPSPLDNTVTVTMPVDMPDPDTSDNTATDSNVLAAVADIVMDKTLVTPAPYFLNQNIQYTLTVTNLGPSATSNIQVTDTPTNLAITAVSGACTALPCTIVGPLAPGASAVITVNATITATGAFSNSATAIGPDTDPDPGNNTDTDGGDATAPVVSINDASASEGSPVVFTVSLSNASASDVTVTLNTANGSAVAPGDYTAQSGLTVTIPAGSLSTTVSVPTIDDTLFEGDETFTATISAPVGATLGTPTGTGTIVENDAAPVVSINDASASEGSPVVFTVSLSNASATDVTVTLNTANGTATAPADYTAQSGLTVTIPAGSLSTTVSVPTIDDALFEGDETFTATISAPVGATLGTPTGTGTIVENDAAPVVSINDASASEGSPVVFTVSLSNASASDVTVTLNTANGSAVAPGDYTAQSGLTVTIPAGTTSVPVSVPTIDDTLFEGDETFTATISNPIGATIGTPTGTGTIVENDAAPVVSINDASASEGSPVVFTVSLSSPSASDVTVTLNTADGSAVAPGDYTAQSGLTVTIPAGSLSTTVSVPTIDDTLFEGDETFTATISAPVGATLGTPTGTGTIVEDDAAPVVSINDASASEGSPVVFTVSLSNTSATDVTVTLNTANGTATAPADYTAQSGLTVTIPAGSLSATVNVPTIDDAVFEGDETFTATISNPVGATIGTPTGIGTIVENDAAPVVSINDASAAEGSPVVFTVSLSNASASDVTVTLNTANGSAVAPGDYTAQSGLTVTLPAGTTSVPVSVPTIDDAIFEGDETFTATISAPVGATIGTPTGTGTIVENDAAPVVSINDASASEGSPVVFTVSLSNASATDVTVTLNTADGTATAPGDYTAQSGLTVTIPAGSLSTTVSVPTIDDTLFEGNETFTATISAPIGATIGTPTGTGTIVENDAAPVVSINDASATEGSPVVFTVSLSSASASDVTVTLNTANGSAVAPGDYTAQSGLTVTLPAGMTSVPVSVPTIDDAVFEGNETFTATISNPVGATIGTPTGTGTIVENDAAPVVSINDASASEGSPVVFTVSLSNASATDVTVTLNTADGTATAPGDYTAQSALTVTIPAGSLSSTVNVPTIDDTLFEGDETFTATISNPVGATIGTPTGTGTIVENEAAPVVSINDASASEGSPVVFTVSLSSASASDVTVTLNTANGTAVAPGDYTAQSDLTVAIPAGSLSTTVSVPTIDDTLFEGDETFTATISAPVGATLGTPTGTGTIVENDAAPVVSINDASATEGSPVVFTVSLSSPSASDVTVTLNTADGSAVAPGDYTAQSGLTVTIPAGSLSTTVSVPTIDDTLFEGDETFTATISNPIGATIGTPTGTGTIVENDAAIIAAPDSGTIPGASGGTAVPNVLVNDSVGGAQATIGNVVLSQVSASSPAISLDPATGAVNIAPGTPAGTYTLTYQICEAGNPGNCATALVTVTVTPALVDAVDDSGTPVDAGAGGQTVANVLTNDTVDGAPAQPVAVILSQVSSSHPGITLDPASGAVGVAPGTPAGDHTLVYRLCEALNPGNCDTATVSVTVTAVVGPEEVVAVDDQAQTPQNTPVTTPVLANDAVDGATPTSAEVVTTLVTAPGNGTVVINPDGTGTYTPATHYSGTDTYVYRICEVGYADNCATATVTVIAQPNNVQAVDDSVETDQPQVNIDVLANDSSTGAPLNPDTLTIVTPPANGTVTCAAGVCTYTPTPGFTGSDGFTYQVCDRSVPTPVCDTATVTITVLDRPAQLRLIKQAGQPTVRVGDLVRYTVIAENVGPVPARNAAFIDTPPAGFTYVDGSLVVDDEDDSARVTGTNPLRIEGIDVAVGGRATLVYYLRVGAGVGPGVHRNHVVGVDDRGRPISNEASAEVTLSGDPLLDDSLIFGSVFGDLDRDGWQDPAGASGVRVQGGFAPEAYVAGSTSVDHGNGPRPAPDASAPLLHGLALGDVRGRSSSGEPAEATAVVVRQTLRELAFRDDFVLTTAEGATVRMNAAGETTVERGTGDAARGLTGQDLEVTRQVSQVASGYEVAYVIRNRGIDERGIPGARLVSVEGLVVKTDEHGRFHLVGIPAGDLVRGSNFMLKVDPASLPEGAMLTTRNPLVRRITAGVPTRFDFGVTLPDGVIQGRTEQTDVELGSVLFAPGSATVQSRYAPLFDGIAARLRQAGGGTVTITAEAEREALAFARAKAVQATLATRLEPALAARVQVAVVTELGPQQALLKLGQSVVLGTLLFDTNQHTLRPQYAGLIREIAAALTRQGGGAVSIIGHADQRHTDRYNLELGLRRARGVYEAIAAAMPPEIARRLRVDITDDPDAIAMGGR